MHPERRTSIKHIFRFESARSDAESGREEEDVGRRERLPRAIARPLAVAGMPVAYARMEVDAEDVLQTEAGLPSRLDARGNVERSDVLKFFEVDRCAVHFYLHACRRRENNYPLEYAAYEETFLLTAFHITANSERKIFIIEIIYSEDGSGSKNIPEKRLYLEFYYAHVSIICSSTHVRLLCHKICCCDVPAEEVFCREANRLLLALIVDSFLKICCFEFLSSNRCFKI